MSDNKKYYYLKLKDNFFDNEEQKILESQINGVHYQNFYLKLCLLSVKSGGSLMFKDKIPYEPNMLSTVLRVNIDTVKSGIELFCKLGLMTIKESGEMYMDDIQSFIGHGSTEAERKKEYRLKIKGNEIKKELGHCPDIRPPEIEIEIEIEKEIYTKQKKVPFKFKARKNVLLTIKEYKDFRIIYSYQDMQWILDKLSSYKEANDKKYKSDAGAIRTWVIEAFEKYKRSTLSYPQNKFISRSEAQTDDLSGFKKLPNTLYKEVSEKEKKEAKQELLKKLNRI